MVQQVSIPRRRMLCACGLGLAAIVSRDLGGDGAEARAAEKDAGAPCRNCQGQGAVPCTFCLSSHTPINPINASVTSSFLPKAVMSAASSRL